MRRRNLLIPFTFLAVLTVLLGSPAPQTEAAITAEQREEIRAVSASLNRIGSLFGRRQFKSSAEGIAFRSRCVATGAATATRR